MIINLQAVATVYILHYKHMRILVQRAALQL